MYEPKLLVANLTLEWCTYLIAYDCWANKLSLSNVINKKRNGMWVGKLYTKNRTKCIIFKKTLYFMAAPT